MTAINTTYFLFTIKIILKSHLIINSKMGPKTFSVCKNNDAYKFLYYSRDCISSVNNHNIRLFRAYVDHHIKKNENTTIIKRQIL